MKFLFQERVQKGSPDKPLLAATQTKGVVRKEDYGARTVTAQKDLHLLKLVEPGDFVISLRSFQGGIELAHCQGIISPAYTVLAPKLETRCNYYKHFFKAPNFIRSLTLFVTGIREGQNIDYGRLSRAYMPLPPEEEQERMGHFLDQVNRRIERTIRAKRKIIALLNEQKQVVIHRAVTRGLDPNVRLKPSGIPWLAEMPEHWDLISVGAATNIIQTGPFGSQLHSHEYISGGTPVINPSHMKDGRIIPDSSISISATKTKELERHKLQNGDIIAARRGELGRCAVVTPVEAGWLCGTGSLLIRCKRMLFNSTFFQMVFASQGIRDSLSLESIGATMDNLNAGMVARLRMPLPSISEQNQIIEFVKIENQRHEIITSAIQREIGLLREYRTRLISDVVTGKLDVREAAACLPDEVEEPDLPFEEDDTCIDELDAADDVEMEP